MQLLNSRAVLAPAGMVLQVPFTSSSTAADPFRFTGGGSFSVVLSASTAAFIRVGTSDVGAASNAHFPLAAGKAYLFKCSSDSTHFRIIRSAADGVLSWYVPGAPDPTVPEILGSGLMEEFDAKNVTLVGTEVSTWQGLRESFSLPAQAVGQRPNYAVDGTNFKGLPVVQTTTAGSRAMTYVSGTDVFAVNSTPWAAVVGRWRVVPAVGGDVVFCFGTAGFTSALIHESTAPANERFMAGTSGGLFLINRTIDTNPHVYSIGKSATQLVAAVDGAPLTPVATADPFTAAVRRISAGIGPGGGQPANFSFAAIVVATSVPSAARISAISALMRKRWGI